MATRKTRPRRMGAPSGSRAKNSAETRERILRAGEKQFARHGLAGARIQSICEDARVNARMVYHYFGDKAGLYVAVLEHALGQLRAEELKLDVTASEPMEGLLTMFDFMFNHFAEHPELIRLLASENLMEAEFLKSSSATPLVASPVIEHIETLIKKGVTAGALRPNLDPLHLYVTMVALCYFHKSNSHSLAVIFGPRILTSKWRNSHKAVARDMLIAYLEP